VSLGFILIVVNTLVWRRFFDNSEQEHQQTGHQGMELYLISSTVCVDHKPSTSRTVPRKFFGGLGLKFADRNGCDRLEMGLDSKHGLNFS